MTIHEHGVRYRIHFEEGHKTGFFCDQRDNRRDLARFCADRSVLDLCCYTGGFGLNALLRGRAREVTCVDLDENAVALARENGNANSVRLSVVHADAFGYMRQMALNERTYGVVVLDPPKLIADRDEVSAGKRKYFDLNVLGMSLVEPGGLLLTCSCSGLLAAPDFQALLRAAARKAGRSVQLLAMTGAAADHPVALDAPEGAYLKAAWLRVGDPVPALAMEGRSEASGFLDGEAAVQVCARCALLHTNAILLEGVRGRRLSCGRARCDIILVKELELGFSSPGADHTREVITRSRGIRRDERARKAEDRAVPLAELMRIEAICDRFEAAWRSDERPDLAAFMADGPGPDLREIGCCAAC